MRFPVLAFTILVAGCVDPAPIDATDRAEVSPENEPELSDVLFAGTDCLQYHAYFATPSSPFTRFLPDGFAFVETQPGLMDLRIEMTQCQTPDSATTAQLWIELPVTPPSQVAVANRTHLLPIEAFVSNESLRSTLENASVPFVVGCHCAARTLADQPLIVDEIVSHSLGGVYELRATMVSDEGAFRDEPLARYIAKDGSLVGILLSDNTNAQNRAFGGVAFTYSGPGGAPPVHAGIIHAVDGVSSTLAATSPVQQSL